MSVIGSIRTSPNSDVSGRWYKCLLSVGFIPLVI
jgi:hypothetical protein